MRNLAQTDVLGADAGRGDRGGERVLVLEVSADQAGREQSGGGVVILALKAIGSIVSAVAVIFAFVWLLTR